MFTHMQSDTHHKHTRLYICLTCHAHSHVHTHINMLKCAYVFMPTRSSVISKMSLFRHTGMVYIFTDTEAIHTHREREVGPLFRDLMLSNVCALHVRREMPEIRNVSILNNSFTWSQSSQEVMEPPFVYCCPVPRA